MSRRTYVDNAYNRRVGRVGMPVGSHVVSRSSGGSSYSSSSYDGCYGYSSSSGSSASGTQRCYVDNASNRELGRVGKPLGTHVVSTTGGASTRSTRGSSGGEGCYVDNEYNRKLGRVGKPLGTHVVSRSGEVTITKSRGESGQQCYVDNPYNRKLGRVGMPLGTCVVSTTGSGACAVGASASRSGGQRCYVDNPYNRKLGRVGKPLGSHVISKRGSVQKLVNEHTLQDLVDALRDLGFSDASRPRYEGAVYILERERVEESWRRDGINPSTDVSRLTDRTSGEIIPYSELSMDKKPIGKGGFGEVFAGRWHGTPIAFKKLLYQHISRKLLNSFTKEMRIFAALNHPNTVKMFGAVVEEGNIGIVMEYMNRSLHRALFWDEPPFPKGKKKVVITQIASALEYLHTNDKEKIAHCDIKSENVLLDHANNAKLTDFGISVIKSTTQTSLSTAGGPAAPPGLGTPRYSAPEVLRGELLSMTQLLRTDIYSLALVVFELLAEEEPFEGLNLMQLQANVGRGDLRPCASEISLSGQVLKLLERCWDGEASKRPTAVEFNREWSRITVLVED